MRTRIDLAPLLPAVLTLIGMPQTVGAAPPRPQGPCDIYGAAGTPCVAAHSTTRALYTSYNGPLYQVKRPSDGTALDIGIMVDGYADAAAQDRFCANALCVINRIYDQSGRQPSPPGAAGTQFSRTGQGRIRHPTNRGYGANYDLRS
jgi:hypothetical protein